MALGGMVVSMTHITLLQENTLKTLMEKTDERLI